MSDPNSDEPTRSLAGSDPERTRLTAPAPGVPRAVPRGPIPARIGRYAIVRVLGEGGMGTVYEAEQDQPKRAVALKVIRAGYLSPQLLRRFGQESQVLGRLQHPGIAQVYEAGIAKDERGHDVPFFAMEFIRGVPLTEYAAQKNPGTRERLDLVARICDAVYHAHQKSVIHRDLKPGNILVDEGGQPKILDFGIARATDSDIQQTTLQTDIGQLIGTIPYMSPEQVSGDPNELDTRSDVYALGVIAYELLAGRLPYDLQRKVIHEAARIIKEEEPTRLSSINRTLRGDVETIVAKALEKDKVRRYQSAEALASDIRRYLRHEPIAARPASTWYQLQKFSRRNTGLVAGVLAAFVILLAGLVVSLYAFAQADFERGEKGKALVRATENEHKAIAEAAAADAARRRAEAINEFVTASLQSSDPNQRGKQGMTVSDAMTQALANLDRGALKDQPATVAGLLRTIANILNGNGRSAEAEAPAVRALKIEQQLHDGDHPDLAASLNGLANVRESLGRAAEAEPLYVQALAMYQRLFPHDHQFVARGLNNLAYILNSQSRAAEAEPLYTQALEMYQRLFRGDHPHVATGLNNLAGVRESLGRAAEAEPMYVQALEMRQRLFTGDHPDVANSLNGLAYTRDALGRTAEAEPLYVQALEMRRRLFTGDHPDVATSLNNLAGVRDSLGRAAEAEPLYVQALGMRQRLFRGDHPDVVTSLNNLAGVRDSLGRAAEAEPLYVQALEMRRRLFPGDHPDVATSLNNLASVRDSLGRAAEAEPLYAQALEMRRRLFPGDHPDVATSLSNLAYVRKALGRASEAESLYVQVLDMNQRLFKGDHPDVASSLNNLALVRDSLGREAEAEPLYAQALEMRQRLYTGDHPNVATSLNNLAYARESLGRAAEAEPLFVQALEMYRRLFDGDHPHVANCLANLARCLAAQGRLPEALARAQEAADMAARILPESHPTRTKCDQTLAGIKGKIEAGAGAPAPPK